ncbi:MAG: ABC transporter substrate-binding protein [Pontixanthobacter sp.]
MRFVLVFAAMLAGCSSQPPPRATSAHPTIVSLNPCTDAILAEVAQPVQILALSHYSQDSQASSMDVATARKFAVTGGTVEEILALKPEVVVAGSFMPPATRNALSDLGIRVETFGIASTIAESDAQIRTLARIAGHPAAGDALVERIDTAVSDARTNAPPLSAVLWQPDGIVPGEGALVSDLMRRAGFASHSAARGLKQADFLSLEQMLADPPQVLLLAGQERSQQHPALARLRATHRAKFDASLLYCGGPTIIRAVERLKAIRAQVAA